MEDRKYRDALKVLQALEGAGHQARLAGGCVRDRLFAIVPKDYDVATTALPEQVAGVFARQNIKVVPTGIDHGTVTLVLSSGPIEVTSLRKDVATDGRRAVVEFGSSFEDDAARRDFTINAMFEDRHGQVFDYFGGRDHIKQRMLTFVGDPEQRLAEDYLRILRFFRFWARFNLVPALGTLSAIAAHTTGIGGLSQERVTAELRQFFVSNPSLDIFEAWFKSGVAAEVFKELHLGEPTLRFLASLSQPIPERHAFLYRVALLLVMPATFDLSGQSIESFANQRRLSNLETTALKQLILGYERLVTVSQESAEVLLFLDSCEGRAISYNATDFFIPGWKFLAEAQSDDARHAQTEILAKAEKLGGHLRTAKLPLNGHDVMQALGVPPGKVVQEALERLRKAYYQEKWRTKEEGLAVLRAEQG